MLPEGTKEGNTLSLIVDKYGYRRTFFAARFSSLELPDKCTMKVEPEYFYVFEILFSFLPSGSKIWDIIGFEFSKKTEDEIFEPNLQVTNIDDLTGEITLKEIACTKEIKLHKDLLPYVRLPAPDNDIINLSVGDKILLKRSKM